VRSGIVGVLLYAIPICAIVLVPRGEKVTYDGAFPGFFGKFNAKPP
jgi:hypothetical protein